MTVGNVKLINAIYDKLDEEENSAEIQENTKTAEEKAKEENDIADYIIQHSVVESINDDALLDHNKQTVAILKPYLHKIKLREELQEAV